MSTPPGGPCRVCGETGVCRCVACGAESCQDTSHLYDVFLTHRYGTKNDEVGSKLAYLCTACGGVVCVACLGLRERYPCPEDQVELYPFQCPRCAGSISVVRFDNVGYWHAAAAMLDVIRELSKPRAMAETLIPYAGYHATRSLETRSIEAFAFGPRPCPMLPGDAWKSVLRYTTADAVSHELTLLRYESPVLRTDLFVTMPGGPVYVGSLEPDLVYYDHRLLRQAGVGGYDAPALSLSLHASELFVAHLGTAQSLELEKVGVVRGGIPEPFPSLAEVGAAPWQPPDRAAERAVKKFEALLKDVTEEHIWDYMWLEAPLPAAFGKRAILALAGSTDLIYYQLVRVIFKGVRYNSTRAYFSHPDFRLAPPAVTRQLKDLVPFGEKSKAICITREFGGSLEQTAFVVADYLFVEHEGMDKSYRPSKQAHVDWW